MSNYSPLAYAEIAPTTSPLVGVAIVVVIIIFVWWLFREWRFFRGNGGF